MESINFLLQDFLLQELDTVFSNLLLLVEPLHLLALASALFLQIRTELPVLIRFALQMIDQMLLLLL